MIEHKHLMAAGALIQRKLPVDSRYTFSAVIAFWVCSQLEDLISSLHQLPVTYTASVSQVSACRRAISILCVVCCDRECKSLPVRAFLNRWYLRQKPVGGGSKAGGIPTLPLPLSLPSPFHPPKFSDKPVGGKVRSSEGEVLRLPPPYKYQPVPEAQ